jgi:hypothetical protein
MFLYLTIQFLKEGLVSMPRISLVAYLVYSVCLLRRETVLVLANKAINLLLRDPSLGYC